MGENPPAFPLQVSNAMEMHEPCYGMSLRDWFAGQALAGASAGLYSGSHLTVDHAATLAGEAYLLADAMLAVRSKDHG